MDIQNRISKVLENELATIYTELEINTGDISPLQSLQWDEITKKAADLFAELLEQNEGEQ
jgi:hypothetical protein